ncbi:MAG: TRAP transporter substrate-binding protein [Proteobacteria bacterium]|nr:TRAP transporter substrate-binding protein [Desulfobacula sp.]MBU3952891.1 TRAP transporter substrate-binding protein [Pseudomonadota bacterium]MBU4133053.1 TRAP transporter substrate-binding protein [Pseudomonadota bacterium]
MVKRAFCTTISFLFFIITCLALFSTPAAADAINLNYANFPPAPTFPCVQMERWKVEVEKRTNNQVAINTFPGGTLLEAKGMMDGVIAGQADIGTICMAYQPGRFIITNATSLPLGIPDAKTGSMALLKLYEKYKPKAFEEVVVLAMFTNAPGNVMSMVPVRTLEDIRGLDLRASGGAAQILKAWGANPVGMPMPATVEALQKGTVKGLFSSLEVMKDFKFAENCKFVTMTETVIYPFSVIMNKSKFNSLPPDVQKVMMDMKEEQSLWTGAYMDEQIKKAIAWSKESNNVEFISLSAEEKARWDAKLEFITQDWIKDATEKGLPAEEIIKDIRAYIQ